MATECDSEPRSTVLELSRAESRLAKCAWDAIVCDLADPDNPAKPAAVVRAEAIRRLLLGLPVLCDGESEVQRVAIAGLSLSHAIVDGTLDLRGAVGPSLALEGCIIAAPMELSGSSLKSLSLRGSRITHIIGRGLRLEGQLDLRHVQSAEAEGQESGARGEGLCWVELTGATVGGRLDAGASRFAAPKRRKDFDGDLSHARYALDLCEIHIRDNLMLEHESEPAHLIGGLAMAGAQIGGECLARGVKLVAEEGFALAAHDLTIHQSMALSVATVEGLCVPFATEGMLDLISAKIGGILDLNGASLGGSVLLSYSAIAGPLRLRVWDGDFHDGRSASDSAARMPVVGDVFLCGAVIDKDIDLRGAHVKGTIDATNARIGGSVRGGAWSCRGLENGDSLPTRICGDVLFFGAAIRGEMNLTGAQIGGKFDAEAAQIGGEAKFRAYDGTQAGKRHMLRFTAGGGVRFHGAKIGGSLNMSGARLSGLLNGELAEINGEVLLTAQRGKIAGEDGDLPFLAPDGVDFNACRVRKNVDLHGASIGDKCDFSNAQITGTMEVKLRHRADATELTFDLSGSKVGELKDDFGRGFGERVRLALDGFQYDYLGDNKGDQPGAPPCWLERSTLWLKQWPRWAIAVGMVLAGLTLPFVFRAFDVSGIIAQLWNGLGWPGGIILTVFAILLLWTARQRRFRTCTAAARIDWLNRQYSGGKLSWRNAHEFSPGPFEQLIKCLRSMGLYDDARRVASCRLALESKYRTFFAWRPFLALYKFAFDYGLSTRRAVLTFALCILLGYVAVTYCDTVGAGNSNIPILVVTTSTASTLVVSSSAAKVGNVLPAVSDKKGDGYTELPCGSQIEPFLYAVDMFVPFLNLDQRNRCSVSTDDSMRVWRFIFRGYVILGYLVTSLTILTISGFLRRHAES